MVEILIGIEYFRPSRLAAPGSALRHGQSRVSATPSNSRMTPSRTPMRSNSNDRNTMVPMTAEKEKAPVDDRVFIQGKTLQVLDELAKAGGFDELVQKGLKSMTHKQFIAILQQFLKFIDGSIRLDGANYIDIIYNLTVTLEYPYTFNKASLKTPSAPHCQNSIIVLLAWFAEFSADSEFQIEYCTTDDFTTPGTTKMFIDKTSEAFNLWNNQQETESDEVIETIRRAYLEKNIGIGGNIDKDIDRLNEHIDLLKNEVKPVSLQKEISSKREELKQLKKRTEELNKAYSDTCDKVTNSKKTLNTKLSEVTAAGLELELMRHRISEQKMTTAKKNQMLMEVAQLKSLLDAKREAAIELSETNSENEIQLSNLIQKKFQLISKLNNLIHRLASELGGLRGNFDPAEYEIKTTKIGDAQKLDEELTQLQRGLKILKENYSVTMNSINQSLMKHEAEKHQLVTQDEMIAIKLKKTQMTLEKLTETEANLEHEVPRITQAGEDECNQLTSAIELAVSSIEVLEQNIATLAEGNKQFSEQLTAFKAQSVEKIRSLYEKRKQEIEQQRQKLDAANKVIEEFKKCRKPFPENVQKIIDQVMAKRGVKRPANPENSPF